MDASWVLNSLSHSGNSQKMTLEWNVGEGKGGGKVREGFQPRVRQRLLFFSFFLAIS